MNDYYQELSNGTFKVEGKFVGWVEVSKKRMEYTTGSGTSAKEKQALLTEALDVYTKKHGKDALAEFDGIFLPLRRRAREHDARRALLAAPGQHPLRRAVAAVLHRPGGRQAA